MSRLRSGKAYAQKVPAERAEDQEQRERIRDVVRTHHTCKAANATVATTTDASPLQFLPLQHLQHHQVPWPQTAAKTAKINPVKWLGNHWYNLSIPCGRIGLAVLYREIREHQQRDRRRIRFLKRKFRIRRGIVPRPQYTQAKTIVATARPLRQEHELMVSGQLRKIFVPLRKASQDV